MKLIDKFFKRKHPKKITISRKDFEIFLIEVETYGGKTYSKLLPFTCRSIFILDLFTNNKSIYFPKVKFNQSETARLINTASRFEHFSDSTIPKIIYNKPVTKDQQGLKISINERELIITSSTLDNNDVINESEFSLEGLSEIVNSLGALITFGMGKIDSDQSTMTYATTQQLHDVEMEMDKGDGNAIKTKQQEIYSLMLTADKDTKRIQLILSYSEDYKKDPEYIFDCSVGEISIILQKIRVYMDSIKEEINKGEIIWD